MNDLINFCIASDYHSKSMSLEEENEILQQKIDKAIDYIENNLQSFLYSVEYKTLLEILKK